MLFGQLAPAGTAVGLADIAGWLGALPRAAQTADALRDLIRQRYGVRHCFLLSSGRAALFLLLRTLARLADNPDRREVVVPSYTCYSVAAAAVRAGLRVRVCDIDPRTLSYDLPALKAIDFRNVLAIVSANLYGLPNDLPAIEVVARRNGVYLVDDAAQCMDARIAGRAVGTFGDAGLFSFDKGKNITSIQGGVIVSNRDEVAAEFERALATLPVAPTTRTATQAAQLFIYAVFLRPWLYWLPASLPFLKLGETPFTTEYPVERYSDALSPIAARLFDRIDAIGAKRAATARALQAALSHLGATRSVDVLPEAQPVFLRLPLLAKDGASRAAVLRSLSRRKLGATPSYPLSIPEVPELQPHLANAAGNCPNGAAIARTIFTLPTHHYVSARHIERIGAAVEEALSSPP